MFLTTHPCRPGEWEAEGRGRPIPPADLLPEWEHPDPRFHDADAGRGRGGRGRGGRGAGGRAGPGRRGGRGPGPYGPHGGEPSPLRGSAMERGWSRDEGYDDGAEWGGKGAALPAADSGGGFQEWSAYDESPPRSAPAPRRAPMARRGHASGPLGPRDGGGRGRGPEQLGPPVADPMDRRMPPPVHGGEHYDGEERPTRMRRREVRRLGGCAIVDMKVMARVRQPRNSGRIML